MTWPAREHEVHQARARPLLAGPSPRFSRPWRPETEAQFARRFRVTEDESRADRAAAAVSQAPPKKVPAG
jgi:hypothetical protein